jgi:hypothetical protein
LWRWRGVSEKRAASEQEKNPDRRKRMTSNENLNVMRYSNFIEKCSSALKYWSCSMDIYTNYSSKFSSRKTDY